jgi:LPXTG-motif cell wall-anchored protein
VVDNVDYCVDRFGYPVPCPPLVLSGFPTLSFGTKLTSAEATVAPIAKASMEAAESAARRRKMLVVGGLVVAAGAGVYFWKKRKKS